MDRQSVYPLDFLLDESTQVSPESKEAFKNCMNSEAIYYGGIPLAIISFIPANALFNLRKTGLVGKAFSLTFAICGYNVGRLSYAGNCARKHVPEYPELLRAKINAMQRGRDQNMGNVEPNTLGRDDQAIPSNYDASLDYNSNQLSDDNDVSNDTLGTEKPINLKQHVTYEELRRQNRGPYYGRAPYYQSRRPVEQKKPAKDTELLEDDSNFNMEDMK